MHCTPALAIRERYAFRKSNIKENSLVVWCLGLGTFNFHCTGSGVQPLVRELRSHKMHSMAERKKEINHRGHHHSHRGFSKIYPVSLNNSNQAVSLMNSEVSMMKKLPLIF